MFSKGVQVYTYINLDGCEVEYQVPGASLVKNELRRFTSDHLEVDKSKLDVLAISGRFTFIVRHKGDTITTQWCDVNVLTGMPSGGTLKAIADQRSIVNDNLIVTYGFYDADRGSSGLPNAHQVFVTVTPNFSRWIGDVAPPNSSQANNNKLTRFVLPTAHDVGMNSMQLPNEMVQRGGKAFIDSLTTALRPVANAFNSTVTPIASLIAPNIISSLSITQKDTLKDILAIGARYFEFRPAHVFDKVRSAVPDEIYFMHGPIPGMLYKDFLRDIILFLFDKPDEIVVVQLRWDGVPPECARPSDSDLQAILDETLANSNLVVGTLDDLKNLSIQQLREQKKRLIMLRNCHVYSTYDDAANATVNGDSILAKFEQLDHAQQATHDMTNVQCQATATNITDVVVHAVMTSDDNNSVLLATKALCDNKLLPWVRDHALDKLSDEGLILLMNDFFDGATADVAVDLTRRRLK